MSAKPDGGPAFPNERELPDHGGLSLLDGGMTPRDYFAASALRGPVGAAYSTREGRALIYRVADAKGMTTDATIAQMAYDMADAMLAERAK